MKKLIFLFAVIFLSLSVSNVFAEKRDVNVVISTGGDNGPCAGYSIPCQAPMYTCGTTPDWGCCGIHQCVMPMIPITIEIFNTVTNECQRKVIEINGLEANSLLNTGVNFEVDERDAGAWVAYIVKDDPQPGLKSCEVISVTTGPIK